VSTEVVAGKVVGAGGEDVRPLGVEVNSYVMATSLFQAGNKTIG
jgi:hypothetical protein